MGQLVLALAGFTLVLIWFYMTLTQYYRQMSDDTPIKSYGRYGGAGAILFVASWFWALFTSISLLRNSEAVKAAPPGKLPPPMPTPPKTPGAAS